MKWSILTLLIILCEHAQAQKFSTYGGVSLGGLIEEKFTYCPTNGKGRIAAFLTQYYHVSENYKLGIKVMTTGIIGSIIGGSGPCDFYDAPSNTQYLNHHSLNAATYTVQNKWYFNSKSPKKYFEIGLGIHNVFAKNLPGGVERVSRSSFVIGPEFGIELNKVAFSLLGIVGGKTPSYNGVDMSNNEKIVLKSVSTASVFLSINYKLFQL